MLPVRPANALPLLAVVDENAYRISLKPCAPGLRGPALPAGASVEIAVMPRISPASTRMASEAIRTSRDSIFLPMYSGVRPTIRPAMNTEMMANTSMK